MASPTEEMDAESLSTAPREDREDGANGTGRGDARRGPAAPAERVGSCCAGRGGS